jgi:tripartite-type tricarboxylate transporter receptor subunit TctC
VGTGFVARSTPDGYTLLVSSSGGLTVNPVMMKNLAYNPEKDFEPIALLSTFPLVLAANARLPFNDYAGLVDFAKRSRQGELNHASITSSFQLVAEMLAEQSKVKFTHINYRGSGPAMAALLGGEIDFAVVDIAAAVGHFKAGTLKPLAVTTPKRSSALPNVPTVAETGFAGFDATIWTGLLAPKGTPEPVLAKLRGAVAAILAEKDTVDRFTELGMEPGDTDGAALNRRISNDIRQWGAIAKKANLQAQ